MEALWRLAGADPWGYSLVELVAKLPQQEDVPALAMWLEEARRLAMFFNGFRSSTGLPDLTPYRVYSNVEARGAIDMARHLLDGARQIVALEETKAFDSLRRDETEPFGPYVSSLYRIGFWLGQVELVQHVLTRRFGAVPADLAARVRSLPSAQLLALLDVTLSAATLAEVAAAAEALAAGAGNGNLLPA